MEIIQAINSTELIGPINFRESNSMEFRKVSELIES